MDISTKTQVVAIGNIYEMVFPRPHPRTSMSRLYCADDRHLSQKAVYWATPFGPPDIVVCDSEPTLMASMARPSEAFLVGPTVLTPERRSSSICSDLLNDEAVQEALLQVLDKSRPVHLAAYVKTTQLEQLAEWLRARGFQLASDEFDAALVARLNNKVEAHRLIFAKCQSLLDARPICGVANDLDELDALGPLFSDQGISNVVVKSSKGAGGGGVFFAKSTEPLSKQLSAFGANAPLVAAPFLVEQRVAATLSPTIDITVTDSSVAIVGVAYQRLFDDRYYTGFWSSSTIRTEPWCPKAEALAVQVGVELGKLGYRGPANVDFLIGLNLEPVLVEVNVRRSALLDVYGFVERTFGSGPTLEVSVADYVEVEVDVATEPEALRTLLSSAGDECVTLCPLLDGGLGTDFHWLGLAVVSTKLGRTEQALRRAIALLTGTEDCDAASAAEVGAIRLNGPRGTGVPLSS